MLPEFRIEAAKLTRYLLDPEHPTGGSKARFFLAHGFSADSPEVLAKALASHASTGWPGTPQVTPYGTKHAILAPFRSPDGSERVLLAIWQMATTNDVAKFVTAYPQ